MTPKEKAKELFNKMFNVDDPMGSYPMCYETAKQCALIAVDEIIKTLNNDIQDINVVGNVLLDLIDYWREVKQEIEQL